MFLWLFDLIEIWKTAKIIKYNRDNNIKTYWENNKAHSEYRKLWPKTPCGCCDDSHEAGWIQGYSFKEKDLGI